MLVKRILIIDHDNGESGEYCFSAGANLLVSNDNTQGKSSLLKTLYYGLGLDITVFPKDWKPSKMTVKIDVLNDTTGEEAYIVRRNDIFYVSGVDGAISIQEYTKWLSGQLGSELRLTMKKTKTTSPVTHPSALIAPFYVDQDASWTSRLYPSFGEMGMYDEVPLRILEYLLKISDDDELKLKEKISKLRKQEKTVSAKRSNVNEVYMDYLNDQPADKAEQVSSMLNPVEANHESIELFTQLMEKANKVYIEQKATRVKLQREYDQKLKSYNEYKTIQQMLKNDYDAIKSVCKTCKSELTQEQINTRMDVSTDLYELSFLISTTKLEMENIEKQLARAVENEEKSNSEYTRLAEQVETNQNVKSIAEYIEVASKKKSQEEFASIIQKLDTNLGELNSDIKDYNKEYRELKQTSTRRIDEINKSYQEWVNDLSTIMQGSNVNDLEFKKFTLPQSSGVNSNQTMLGGYLVYMRLIAEYGRYSLPFCIDSFIKNETAANKSDAMFAATEKYLLGLSKQSIFSAIDESVNSYMKNADDYNHVRINGRLLSSNSFKDSLSEIESIITVD